MTEKWATVVITSSACPVKDTGVKTFNILYLLSDSCGKEAVGDFAEAAEKVLEKGCGVFLMTTKRIALKKENPQIKVFRLLKNSKAVNKNAKIIEEVIKEYHIDIVHSCEPLLAVSANKAAEETGAKHITTIYKQYRKLSFRGFMLKYGMAKADLVIASSMQIAAMARDIYKISESRIRTVYSGVDNEEFSPDTVQEETILKTKEEMNIQDDEVILLLSDAQSWREDIDCVSEALRNIKDKWALIIVVNGEEAEEAVAEITEETADSEWKDKIKVLHSEDEITPDILALSDIVLINGEKANSSKIIMKAESMGKIVVAEAQNQNTDIIKNGLTSFLYEDEEGLVDTMVKVFAMTAKEKERISATAINCAASDFSNSTMRTKLFKAYEELM